VPLFGNVGRPNPCARGCTSGSIGFVVLFWVLLDGGTVRKTTREGVASQKNEIQKRTRCFHQSCAILGSRLRSCCSYAGLESFKVLLGPVDSKLSSTLNNVSFKTAQPTFESSLSSPSPRHVVRSNQPCSWSGISYLRRELTFHEIPFCVNGQKIFLNPI
jgi:hypothetical protein